MNQEVIVPFNGQKVLAVKDQDGKVWISVKRICENIGVDHRSQKVKIQSDSRFRWGDITLPSEGGEQSFVCIPLEQLNGWLFTINASKVREDIRPRLLRYQHECMDVLYKHFMPRGEQDLSGFMSALSGLETKLEAMHTETREKLDQLNCVAETVFGNDQKEIQDLVSAVAKVYGVDGRTVWGWIQTECDVSSYKRQNLRVKNFLRNKLGKGLRPVENKE